MEFGIGSSVWKFDDSHRVYAKGQSGPLWRMKWVCHTVTGETAVSWIVGDGYAQWKLSKKEVREGTYNVWPKRIALSPADIDRYEYVEKNRYRIAHLVDVEHDYYKLMEIAQIIGYKEEQ